MDQAVKPVSVHSGHRQRLRSRFIEKGFTGQAPHEVLELLLTYAIPQRDVNDLAHTLIQHFGSLSGVLEASVEELTEIKGISENSAVLLTMVPALSRLYEKDKWRSKPKIETAVKAKQYTHTLFIGETYEVFYLLCLDSQCHVLKACRLSQGTIDQAAVYTRNVVETALRYKSQCVMLAHNHPGGKPSPSTADIVITKAIFEALKLVDIRLLDHIIVAGEDTYTFSSEGMENNLYGTGKKKLVAETPG